MSYTKINKEGLITYVFKFRRGKRIHTALQMSRSKKLKIIMAERFISHHELAIGVDYAGDASPPDFVMNHFVPTTLKQKNKLKNKKINRV